MGKKKSKKQKRKQRRERNLRPAFTLQNKEYYLDSLHTAINASKFRQASVELKNVKKCDPDADLSEEDAKIKCLRGNSFLEKKNFKEALAEFQAVLETTPGRPEAVRGACLYYIDTNQIAAGLEWIKGLFESGELPKDLSVLYLKFLFLAGRPGEAAFIAFKEHPKKFWAADRHWLDGVLLIQNKEFEEAELYFSKAKKSGVFLHQSRAWMTWARAQNHDWKTFNLIKSIEPESLRLRIQRDICVQYFPDRYVERNIFSADQQRLRILIDVVKHGDWIEAAKMIDDLRLKFPEGFKKQREFRGHIYRLGAITALERMKSALAANFAFQASRLFPDDLEMLFDFCIRFASTPASNVLTLYKRAAELLKKKHLENPKKYPKHQVEYYHGELDALKSAVVAYGGAKSKAWELSRSALQKAPDSYHSLFWTGMWHKMDRNPEKSLIYFEKAFHKANYQESDYHLIVDALEDMQDYKKLKEFRREFGGRFGDEIFSNERLRRRLAFILSKKDYMFVGISEENIERELYDAPVYKKILNLFEEIFGDNESKFQANRKASVKPKRINDWIKKELLPLDSSSFAYITSIELLTFGLRHMNLKKNDQRIFSTLEELSRQTVEGFLEGQMSFEVSEPDQELAKQNRLLVQIALKKDKKTIKKYLDDYLRASHYPAEGLIELQWILSAHGRPGAIRDWLKERLKKDPENPGLNLAYAESLPESAYLKKDRFRKKGLELAGRLQDQKALDAHKESRDLQEDWIHYNASSPFDNIGNIFKDFMDSMDSMNPDDVRDFMDSMDEGDFF